MIEIQSTVALFKITSSWSSMKFVMNANITLRFVMILALETFIISLGFYFPLHIQFKYAAIYSICLL